MTPTKESSAARVITIKSSGHNVTDEARRRPGGWVPNKLNSNSNITKVLKNYYHRQHHDHCLIKSCRPLVKGHSTTPNHSTILHLSNSFPKSSVVNHHWSPSSQRYFTKFFPLQCASREKRTKEEENESILASSAILYPPNSVKINNISKIFEPNLITFSVFLFISLAVEDELLSCPSSIYHHLFFNDPGRSHTFEMIKTFCSTQNCMNNLSRDCRYLCWRKNNSKIDPQMR